MADQFELTPDQQKAVDSDENMVITACPGSGKTTVVVEKIRKEIPNLESYQGVIGITFTVKASKELKRKCKRDAFDIKSSFFGTIDHFCLSEIIFPFANHIYGAAGGAIECIAYAELDASYQNYLPNLNETGVVFSTGDYRNFHPQFERHYKDGFVLLEAIGIIANHILTHSIACKRYFSARYTSLYVDEYQTFATQTFPQLQSEARKYAIDTVVAHQYRDQLDDENQGSTLNVANLITLRVSGKDAVDLAAQYDLTPPPPEVKFEPIRYPVDEDGTIFTTEASLGTRSKLEQLVEGPSQLYSDVHLETANLLAQLPNYQAICRVLNAEGVPRTLQQFRINFADKPGVGEKLAADAEAYLRQSAREHAVFTRREIAAYIAEYTHSSTDEGGSIPAYDVQ